MLGLMVLMLMVTSTSAQKGGAKSAMRNRGRGGGRGRGSNVRRGYSDNGAGGVDSLGGGSGRKACIGLCYLRYLSDLNISWGPKPRLFMIYQEGSALIFYYFVENYRERSHFQSKKRENHVLACAI